jgi:hypothetical protein
MSRPRARILGIRYVRTEQSGDDVALCLSREPAWCRARSKTSRSAAQHEMMEVGRGFF